MRRYLAFAEGPELERGLALFFAGDSQESARQLEIAVARPIGRRSSSARRGLAHAAVMSMADPARRAELGAFARADIDDPDVLAALTEFARGRLAQAERRLMAYLARAPDRAECFGLLAAIREARGEPDGALAALELAVGLNPRDLRMLSRYTVALASRGDVVGAVRSAEAEIALNPQNPHPQAFLAQLLIQAGWSTRALGALDRALALVGEAPDLAEMRATLTARRAALLGEAAPA